MLQHWKNVILTASLVLLMSFQAFAQMKKPQVEFLDKAKIRRLELKNARLIDAARLISEMTGLNIVVTPTAGEKRVNLYLKDISPKESLKTMCKLNNLWFVEEDNAIRIMSAEDYGKELTIHRDEKTFVYKLKYASSLAVADLLANLYGTRIEYQKPEQFESYGHVGTERNSLDDDSNLNSVDLRDRGRSGDLRDTNRYRANTTRYDETYAARRFKEALEIEKDFTAKKIEYLENQAADKKIEYKDALGVSKEQAVVYLAVFLRNNSIACRSVDLRILEDIGLFIKQIDTPTPQVLLEGKILEITLTDDFKSFFDFDIASKSGKHRADIGNFTSLDSATVIYQFLDEELKARVELFKEDNQAKVIGTPMILSANNAPGDFFVGEERPITINYEQEIREFDERTTETVRPVIELRDIGTKLTITPSINEDRTVTMRFLAEVGTVNSGGASISLVDQAGNILALPIDTVDTSRIENIIVAKDGATLAIGGLIRETNQNFQRKVPILGDVPGLGVFFRKNDMRKQKTETVFLITPHLMMAPDEGEAVSDQTISTISEHPYHNGQKKLFYYDEQKKKLHPTDGKDSAEQQSEVSRKINGKILRVDTDNKFAIINVGKEAGIKEGDILSAYREDKLIGKVKIINLRQTMSSVEAVGDTSLDVLQEGDQIMEML